ncbi:MAG: hypothetical protein M1296_07575 [Chloroflexi bacterium]|nr:hypothetical protein [Chloroflexota bacterium]
MNRSPSRLHHPSGAQEDHDGGGWLVFLPLVFCSGPLLLAAVVAPGATSLSGVGTAMAVVALAAALLTLAVSTRRS